MSQEQNHPKLKSKRISLNNNRRFTISSSMLGYIQQNGHCITQYIKQNYHWTDGFFVKNHPLKAEEKQCEFCFLNLKSACAAELKCAGRGTNFTGSMSERRVKLTVLVSKKTNMNIELTGSLSFH